MYFMQDEYPTEYQRMGGRARGDGAGDGG